jgi:hypothetical protein
MTFQGGDDDIIKTVFDETESKLSRYNSEYSNSKKKYPDIWSFTPHRHSERVFPEDIYMILIS